MKRIFAIVLALVLCVSLMSVTAMATGTAYLGVGSVNAEAGSEVTVPVYLSGNTAIAGMDIAVSYDSTMLELVGMVGTPIGGVWTIGTHAIWDNGENVAYNGQILAITFKVKADAEVGDTANVSVSCTAFRLTEDGKAYEAVSVGGSTGTVTIVCNHAWNAGVVTTPATCTEDGVMTYTCTKCGETKTAAIPAAHSWQTAWSYDHLDHWHACSACDAIKDKDAHTMLLIYAEAPTKDQDGYHLYDCESCDYQSRDVWPWGEEPKVGDIRPMMLLGVVGVLSVLAAASYVFKRKNVI